MLTSAKLSRISFSVLLLNLLFVIGVAALRPVFARQEADDQRTADPEVQLPPADPPALDQSQNFPLKAASPTNSEDTASPNTTDAPLIPSLPPASAHSTPAPPNPMVLDEILKAIQNSRGELDVPPLSYPALPLGSSGQSSPHNLEKLSHRMKSIAAVTRSAQVLIREAQFLQSKGQSATANELIEQVQTLKSILVQLAADSSEAVPPISSN